MLYVPYFKNRFQVCWIRDFEMRDARCWMLLDVGCWCVAWIFIYFVFSDAAMSWCTICARPPHTFKDISNIFIVVTNLLFVFLTQTFVELLLLLYVVFSYVFYWNIKFGKYFTMYIWIPGKNIVFANFYS